MNTREITDNKSGGLPAYSVLMSVYIKEKAVNLREALNSIWMQTYPSDDVVLVCDGPLTPALEDVVVQMQREHEGVLHVVRLEKNCGLPVALNFGLQFCRHELIARMDSDDISRNDRCEQQVKTFMEKPDVAICSGIVEEFYASVEEVTARRVPPETHAEICSFAKRRNPFNHPCVMFRKSAVLEAGSYRSLYLLEDYDLWVRMLQRGYIGYNLQVPLLWMRAGSDLYLRRGGLRYVKNQIMLFETMRESGFINGLQFIRNVTERGISSVIPNYLRTLLFRFLLRE